MSGTIDRADGDATTPSPDDAVQPLPGEPGIPSVARQAQSNVSKKGLLTIALLVLSFGAVSAISVQRFFAGGKKDDDATSKRAGDRPAVASIEPKRLDMTVPTAASAASTLRIPAIVPTDAELAEPIGVRRTGTPATTTSGTKAIPPEDAPTVLVSSRPTTTPSVGSAAVGRSEASIPGDPLEQTRRNLDGYQRQLQVMLDTLTKSTAAATGQPPSGAPIGAIPPFGLAPAGGVPATGGAQTAGLFGGQLPSSSTPRVSARMLGDRSLVLPKGTAFTCALKTKVVSATSGLIGCQVQRNVYSDDGRVLLIERGSHMDGEYRVASVRPGTVRIPVVWTRIQTPNGVTVDIDSPGTGQLGESGIDGYVDNRWVERIGAALLLSVINDAVQLAIQHEGNGTQGNAVVLSSTTSTGSKLAEKVLDSTINIPPLIYQNQGGIVGIYVARDVDFSSVYELQPTEK